jgi:hypothetical protein
MRPVRSPLLALLTGVALVAFAPVASASGAAASWQLARASAPPPPPGTPPASFGVPLGKVSDISFWSPNRGLLIEEGTDGCLTTSTTGTVPCGLYAYNGEGWHLLSEVCGASADEAHHGEIAWAGPDEFWTISDQRPGQVIANGGNPNDVSLCHFLDGKVVASYAVPLNQPNEYKRMDAAACLSPSNCWFGGEALGENTPFPGTAFHLHWNGLSLTAVHAPADHAITSMALANQSTLFESVKLAPGDLFESEDPAHPSVVHQIDPPGSNIDFHDVFMTNPGCESEPICTSLPEYGAAKPESLAGFSLSSDYTPSGSNPGSPELWALAGRAVLPGKPEPAARPSALRYSRGEQCEQSPSTKGLPCWSEVGGTIGEDLKRQEEENSEEPLLGIAAEPGSAAAWLTLGSSSRQEEAHVERLTVGEVVNEAGRVESIGKLEGQQVLGTAQEAGAAGTAGPIACPAANDCWLATSKGFLFHLTEDPAEPDRTEVNGRVEGVDTDSNFAGVITFRPPDEAVPGLPSIEPPPEESTSLESKLPPLTKVQTPATRTSKALVTDVHSHVVHRDMLELSFKLTVKARVQLLASRKGRRVAQTARRTLKAGKHTLMLRLNPHHWPNALNLKATPLEALPTVESKAPSSGQTVAPPVGANTVGT